AEMQYLLGVSFGAGGVLDTVANVKIGDLNSAINDIKFEDVLPDFDRDFYAEWDKTGAVLYKKESGGEIKLKQLIEADGTSEFFKFVNTEAKDPAKTYYKLNREEGTIKVSDAGNWELIKELPDFNNRYDISGKRNRFGLAYVVLVDDNQIKITKRYADRDCTVENEDGMYYFKYTKDAAGTNYRYGAAVRTKIQDATGTEPAKYAEIIEWRGYVETTKADYFEAEPWKTYGYSRDGKVTDEELREHPSTDSLARYALVHVGKSEPVLKALADETLNTLDGAIGDMKLGQVIEITDDSADILKKLKDSKISEIDKDVKNVKVGDIMKVVSVTTAEKATDGAYIALPALSAGKEYKGTFITAKDGDKTVYLVKYKDGLAGFGDRYNITEKASNGVVVALADKTIGELQTAGIDDLVNAARLSSVMDIDGDVFVSGDDFPSIPKEYVLDGTDRNGFFRLAAAGETAEYKRVYEGDGNAVVKKLSTIGVNNIAARMDNVVNSTLLKEVVEVKERYKLKVATAADIGNRYISLADVYTAPAASEYAGTFNVGYVETDPDTDIKFVRARGTIAAGVTQYVIVDKASSGVLIGLQDKTIGTLSTGVDEVVNGATLSDVLEIDGKVYVKATDFDAAVATSYEKIGQHVAYYKDGNLFLEAGYVRNNNGDYVYLDKEQDGTPVGDHIKFGTLYNEHGVEETDGAYFKYNGNLYKLSDYKRYKFDGETADEYYACIYEGESDKILSKMATMTVKDLSDSGTMDKIVKDMRIGDVMELNDKNSVLYELGNSKISSIEAEVTDKIKVATIRDLNKWGSLGLTEEELNKTVKVTGKKVGEMKAADFIRIAIRFATE
ncbi:MAG: stage V sporulation protein AA, partial [Clostridiales bacterium]|nr:stage V sporulation protein AA [Clostridiales bacterium]